MENSSIHSNVMPIQNVFANDESVSRKFVALLAEEALLHRAVTHPYLTELAAGTLPDIRWALADFARHYIGYSGQFPRYLTATMSRLEVPAHRIALLENLTEESGTYEADEIEVLEREGVAREWFDGVAHPQLFERFAQAMGVRERGEPVDQVICWRESFINVLTQGSAAEAIGALGFGTENIVSTIYVPFVKALEHTDLSPRDTVFFKLHTMVDDHHQATLQDIAADFAATEEGRKGLRRGMLKALSLRSAFWDWLYARALEPESAEAVL
jgi:pyrroloquinoline quinone (PQQ) biosynthesis protein C